MVMKRHIVSNKVYDRTMSHLELLHHQTLKKNGRGTNTHTHQQVLLLASLKIALNLLTTIILSLRNISLFISSLIVGIMGQGAYYESPFFL